MAVPISDEFKQQLREFLHLRAARDTAKAAAKRAEEAYREAEAEVWQAIEDCGLKGDLKLDLGEPHGEVRFGKRATDYGRVLDKDKALDYFDSRAMTDENTETKISEARLNELVKNILEAGGQMPPGIDYYTRRYVAITLPKTD